MLGHEGRDEEVGVVVAFAQADGGGDAGLAAGLVEQVGLELLVEEIVGAALVDEQRGRRAPSSISATASYSRQAARSGPR